MKKLKLFLLALAVSSGSVLMAGTNEDDNRDTKMLKAEVEGLLEGPEFAIVGKLVAYVSFSINQNNEIEVLSVEPNDDFIKDYVEERLQNRKLKSFPDENDSNTYSLVLRINP